MAEPAQVTILAIGAHPDDCDFGAAGMAALWIRSGYRVHFVAMTNGDAGHQEMSGAALARRRLAEAQAAGAVLGVTYTVLDNHDGELEPTLANRRTVIRLIREIRPDLVLTHRLNDYHPDHRYTALLVQDAAYMVTVPGVVAHTPHLARNPIFGYMHDIFQRPYPLTPDVVVDIDAVVDLKLQMLHQHTSQMYEWLPYNGGYLDQVPPDEGTRLAWLGEHYLPRFARVADRFRGLLEATYGPERGRQVRYAEAIEISEYGAPLTGETRRRLFPFLP
ncbi:MAG TPA: PIG-L family deacetylase [Chloroflexota bacterium]|nr:PIG-L family deacetylase [Chloroflexota bacterium]